MERIAIIIAFATLIIGLNCINIKISEGIDKMSDKEEQADPVIAEAFSGPSSLSFLNNNCFKSHLDRYEYTVCPFQNVTQRRTVGQSKPIVMGVWGKWVFDEENSIIDANGSVSSMKMYNKMEFVDGKECGGNEVHQSILHLDCGNDDAAGGLSVPSAVTITEIDESIHCKTFFYLNVPISCSLLII